MTLYYHPLSFIQTCVSRMLFTERVVLVKFLFIIAKT